MHKVTILCCPTCTTIAHCAQNAAAELRKIQGLEVELADGKQGQFTVLVDGQEVIQKDDQPPSVNEVVTAVKDVVLTKQSV